MTTATYPSEQHPAPPPITIDVPDEWETVQLPGVALAVRDREKKDFSPNVVVRVGTRLLRDQPADIHMEITGSMQNRPDAQVSAPTTVSIDGRDWTRIVVKWADEAGMPIWQEHVSVGIPRDDAVQHFFHLTGSTGGAGIDSDLGTVQRVLNSARIDA